jgi:hypothetical protein
MSCVLLIFQAIVSSTVFAKNYELNLSLCETKTDCKTCIENISVMLRVDEALKTVTASGRSNTGERVEEILARCTLKSVADWQCEEFRGLIVVTNGKLSYSPRQTMLGKGIEICQK